MAPEHINSFCVTVRVQGMPAFCCLCGVPRGIYAELDAAALKAALCAHFSPGQFAYASVMQLQDQQCVAMCKQCTLMLKRTSNSRHGKAMLPADRVLCFMLDPGSVDKPDLRNLRRILESLEATNAGGHANAFLSFPEVKRIAAATLRIYQRNHDEVDSVAMAWWFLNGRCTFFRNPRTARLVRHAIKRATRSSWAHKALDDWPQEKPPKDDVLDRLPAGDDDLARREA